jgi:GT2 family glycosyltransferase
MDLSIIIINWNSASLLQECLKSIEDQCTGITFEAIVVDNFSDLQDVEILRTQLEQKFQWAKFIYNATNLGFAKANNLATNFATGKFVLLLNPDTCFIKQGFSKLLELFEDENTGIVSCKLLNGDQTIQLSCFYFPTPLRVLVTSFLLHKVMPQRLRRLFVYTANDHNRPQNPDWVLGAFMLLPRTIMEQVDGFDEEIFMYGEDMDLCYKVKSLDLKIVYSPEFELVHYGGCSGRKAWSNARKEMMVFQAIFRFYRKHLGKGKLRLVRIFYTIGTLLRLILYGLACLFPGRFKRGAHELRTQYSVLLGLLDLK